MRTILDNIMGSVLWQIAWRLLLWFVAVMGWIFIFTYIVLLVFWK
jgi:hypothetical protein